MVEMGQQPESARTQRPSLLDIAKIDGSWAQVIGGGRHVNYLRTKKAISIEWDDYTLVKYWGSTVKLLQEHYEQYFSPKEITNIHWGPEEKEHPELKKLVTVFGEYEKKQHKRK